MVGLSELRQTRYYQDVMAQGELKAKLQAVPELIEEGLSVEQIARVVKLPLEVVYKEAENYQAATDIDLIEMRILEDLLNKSEQEVSMMFWRCQFSLYREALVEGKQKVKLQAIPELLEEGLSIQAIARALKLALEVVQQEAQKFQQE